MGGHQTFAAFFSLKAAVLGWVAMGDTPVTLKGNFLKLALIATIRIEQTNLPLPLFAKEGE
jgi:hypothetical protein